MIKKTNMCDQIVEEITAAIVDGRLKVGDQLPNEREMAKLYGVSRVPLREALRSLGRMGIIETKHGIGTFVKEVTSTPLTNELSSYLYLQENPVIEILQLRRLLEVESARMAAEKASQQDLEKLRTAELVAKEELFKLREGQGSSFYTADLNYHLAIAEASHNSLFVQFINSIHGTLHIHQILSQKEPQPIDEVARYHRQIREAIEEKDPDKAGKVMLDHINKIEELILKGLKKKIKIAKAK
ncbi:MAG: FadR/GntR family transcriptional regulator [Negativicutes bacterium]|nr:FadR/GntR family transcriptional regulator [Negativicutes bacterium]